MQQLAHLSSGNAAKIFGLSGKGSIQNGFDADITLVDLKKEHTVSSEFFGSFSDYLVYEGWNLRGWPITTMVRGKLVTENMQVVGKLGHGQMVKRNLS